MLRSMLEWPASRFGTTARVRRPRRRFLSELTGSRPIRPARAEVALVQTLEDRALLSAIQNLPGFTTHILNRNDDGSTAAVPIGFDLDFYGVSRSSLYVNNNGNVTLDASLSAFTPFPLTSTNRQIIAPFFADVDTRNGASGVVTYGNDVVDGHAAFGVDYIDVGYFNEAANKLNSFQLILVDRSDTGAGNFDIEFNYDKIQWETGDASGGSNGLGGSSARAGYSNGTGVPGTSFELDGSAVNGAFLDTNHVTGLIYNSLGSSVAGRYIFQARGGILSLQPGFDSLSSPTITQGQSSSTTLSGHIAAGSQVPPGDVSITLNGVTQQATIDPATGNFSSTFSTSGLTSAGSPYPVTYSYAGGSIDTIMFGSATDTSQSVTVLAVPSVLGVVVDDGTGQRSMVRSLDVTFNQAVTLDAGAFSLAIPSGAQAVSLSFTTSTNGSGQTVAHVTFAGAGILAGSLQDGRYTLTTLTSHVHNVTNAGLASDSTFGFFRFYGDTNGDGAVDTTDYNAFRAAYLAHDASASDGIFDFNGDGTLDSVDLNAFTSNFRKRRLP